MSDSNRKAIQKVINNDIFEIYSKDASALININDNTNIASPNYRFDLLVSNDVIESSSQDSITITLTNMSDSFKNSIKDRYTKYQYYKNKYDTYVGTQFNITGARDLYVLDIQARIDAYTEKIAIAREKYKGQFDNPNEDDYNVKVANYIYKYENKILSLKNKYYENDEIKAENITQADIDEYIDILKNKYESLDDLHIVPVVTVPSKALISNAKHKYGRNNDRDDSERWKSKWVDSQLQYYKNGGYPVNTHGSRMLLSKDQNDKYQFAIAKGQSLLSMLYDAIISNEDLQFQLSAQELRKIYSELILSINSGSTMGYGGRYWFNKYKKYLQSINQLRRLKYFNFKYMLVDMHTTRRYTCNSKLITYKFKSSENAIETIQVVKYFDNLNYFETESVDPTGLIAFGTFSDGTSKDISDEVVLRPFHNLPFNGTIDPELPLDSSALLDIDVYYVNGPEEIKSATPIKVKVRPLMPESIEIIPNYDKYYGNFAFDASMMIDQVVARYNDTSITKNVKNEAVYVPDTSIVQYNASNGLSVSYTRNGTSVDSSIIVRSKDLELSKLSVTKGVAPPIFEVYHQLEERDLRNISFDLEYRDASDYSTTITKKYFPMNGSVGFTYNIAGTNSSILSNDASVIIFQYSYQTNDGIKSSSTSLQVGIAQVSGISIKTMPNVSIYSEVPIVVPKHFVANNAAQPIIPSRPAFDHSIYNEYNNQLDVDGTKLEVHYTNGATKEITCTSSNVIYGLSGGVSMQPGKQFRLIAVLGVGTSAELNGQIIDSTTCYNENITLNSDIDIPGHFTLVTDLTIGMFTQNNLHIEYDKVTTGSTVMITLHNPGNRVVTESSSTYVYTGPDTSVFDNIKKSRYPSIPNKVLVTFKSQEPGSRTLSKDDDYITFMYESQRCDFPITMYKISGLSVDSMNVSSYAVNDTFARSSINNQVQDVSLTAYLQSNSSRMTSNVSVGLNYPADASVVYCNLDGKTLSPQNTNVKFTYYNAVASAPIQVATLPVINVKLTNNSGERAISNKSNLECIYVLPYYGVKISVEKNQTGEFSVTSPQYVYPMTHTTDVSIRFSLWQGHTYNINVYHGAQMYQQYTVQIPIKGIGAYFNYDYKIGINAQGLQTKIVVNKVN